MIQAYARDPINQYVMENFTISFQQENSVCGDMIIVYVRIEDDCIVEFSHAWAPQMFTSAAASLLAEHIQWKKLSDILSWDYSMMQWLGFEVSPRRRRSAVSALLAVRNAIHTYLDDGLHDTYTNVL